ncbi:MAG: hypothetical protein IK082_01845 [Oscillospiraceae bacterium]|nr:hypothetical protein [Oscillospiraceae bacterium]
MSYSSSYSLSNCKEAFDNKNTFYNEDFINYRGKTSDTKEYFTEIIAKFLCEHVDEYVNGISRISRTSPYKTKERDGKYDPASNHEEERIAKLMFNQSRDRGAFNLIGTIEDYQTPLRTPKDKSDDKKDGEEKNQFPGKIDLLACDGQIMRILELKRPKSKETMLRCVLECFTYLRIVDCDKLVIDFGYKPAVVSVEASPLVPYKGSQHKEMSEERPHLHELMRKLKIVPYYYYIFNNGYYDIVRQQ